MSEMIRVLDEDNFGPEVLRAEGPVLVDFWAAWCPPCRKLAPVLDEVAQEYAGRVKVGKLDVDYSPEVAAAYGITSIPALLLFRDGAVVAQRVGFMPREALRALLEAHVGQEALAER